MNPRSNMHRRIGLGTWLAIYLPNLLICVQWPFRAGFTSDSTITGYRRTDHQIYFVARLLIIADHSVTEEQRIPANRNMKVVRLIITGNLYCKEYAH